MPPRAVIPALLYANGNLELALNTLFFNEEGGMIAKLSDSSNVGILVFLVMLGILVALMNKAGGSAAFGRWASKHIHSRAGAQFATLLLDERNEVSYPDAKEADNGYIYVTYDWERVTQREILMARFTEDDILRGKILSPEGKLRVLVNKALGQPDIH